MFQHSKKPQFIVIQRMIHCLLILSFCVSQLIGPNLVYAQAIMPSLPSTTLPLNSSAVLLKGIKIFPDNPLQFDFIVDPQNSGYAGTKLKEESEKLIKYFMAGLTVPPQDMWVNLSPTEKDRIIPKNFGTTDMGRDLLAQDYILKQITASLMSPETESGKKLWDKIHAKVNEKYGNQNISVEMLDKVWIVPQKAEVFVNGETAFVTGEYLKVMLKEDYEAPVAEVSRADERGNSKVTDHALFTSIIQETIIPEIEKEVNEGKDFAQLRQIYGALILAEWYKRKMKESVLGEAYVAKNKIGGIEIDEKNASDKIYEQYLAAFKKGAYEYIKDEYDSTTQEVIPRKYFSGGANFSFIPEFKETRDSAVINNNLASDRAVIVSANFEPWAGDKSILLHNAYTDKVINGLGATGEIKPSTDTASFDSFYIEDKHQLSSAEYILNQDGRKYFDNLFKINSDEYNVSLYFLDFPEKNLSVPFSFVLENKTKPIIYHLQVFKPAFENANEVLQDVRFKDRGMYLLDVPFKDIFRNFHRYLKDNRKINDVEGAILATDIENIDVDGNNIALPLLYVSQPPYITPPLYQRVDNRLAQVHKNDPYHDTDIVMGPDNEYHRDFLNVLNHQKNLGMFQGKRVGVIGTGQGSDIITLLTGKPKFILANDISPLAVMVSRWNVALAQSRGIGADIPVSIIENGGIDGVKDTDMVVWNTPGIFTVKGYQKVEKETFTFAQQNQNIIYGLDIERFEAFLKDLSSYLNVVGKKALLRIELDDDLVGSNRKESQIIERLLARYNLAGQSAKTENASYEDIIWVSRNKSIADKAANNDLPSHRTPKGGWKPEWPVPTDKDIKHAKEYIKYVINLDEYDRFERDGSGKNFVHHNFEDAEESYLYHTTKMERAQALIAIYYLYPEIAGAILASFPDGFHGAAVELLRLVGSDVPLLGEDEYLQRAEFVGVLINNALKTYHKYVSKGKLWYLDDGSAVQPLNTLGYPQFENKDFKVRFNLDGVAGIIGYVRVEAGLKIIEGIDDELLPLILEEMIAHATEHGGRYPGVGKTLREVLEKIPDERLQRIEPQLGEEAKDYFSIRLQLFQAKQAKSKSKSTKPSLPEHWNPQWPVPTEGDKLNADVLLSSLQRVGIHRKGTTFIYNLKSILGKKGQFKTLSALYYLYPEIAGSLIAGLSNGYHGDLANAFGFDGLDGKEYQQRIEIVSAMINTGLKAFQKHVVPGTPNYLPPQMKSYPQLKGEDFKMQYDLVGLAGATNYLEVKTMGRIFEHLDDDGFPLLINKIVKYVLYENHHYDHSKVIDLLNKIPLERWQRISSQLSPSVRHYLISSLGIYTEETASKLPSHWNPAWPVPTEEDIGWAKKYLEESVGSERIGGGGEFLYYFRAKSKEDIFTDFHDISRRTFRAIYYLYPELAGAMLVSIADLLHGDVSSFFGLYNLSGKQREQRIDFISTVINRGLKDYQKNKMAGKQGYYVKLGDKELSMYYDLNGIAGVMGYLKAPDALEIIKNLDDSVLYLLIEEMREYASKGKNQDTVVEILQQIPRDRMQHLARNLSPEVRDYFISKRFISKVKLPKVVYVDHPTPSVAGEAVGKLVVLNNDQLDRKTLRNLPRDIVVAMDYLPTSDVDIGPFRGIMSFRQGAGDHAKVRAEHVWNVPHAFWPGPESLKKLKGKIVYFQVTADEVILREATKLERKTSEKMWKRPHVQLPLVDLENGKFIIGPNDPKRLKPELVSHKAALLNQAALKGIKVSDDKISVEFAQSSVIPFAMFKYVLSRTGKFEEFHRLLSQLNVAGDSKQKEILDKIKGLIQSSIEPFEQDFMLKWTGLQHDFPNSKNFFVRIMTNAENLPDYPGLGRGIYKTIANLNINDGKLSDFIDGYASVWGELPYKERRLDSIDEATVYPAIGLYPSVKGEYSFVVHTSNTALKQSHQESIRIVQGAGESLVSDDPMFAGEPTIYIWDKNKNEIIKSSPSTKQRQVILGDLGGTVIEETNPDEEFIKQPQAERLVKALAEIGKQVEAMSENAWEIEGVSTRDINDPDKWIITLTQLSPAGDKAISKKSDASQQAEKYLLYTELVKEIDAFIHGIDENIDIDTYLLDDMGVMFYPIDDRLVQAVHTVLEVQDINQTKKFIKLLDEKILPELKAKGHPLTRVLPEAADWFVFAAMFLYEDKDQYVAHSSYLAQLSNSVSPQLSAVLFSALGPHLRENYDKKFDGVDLKLYPVLLKGFLPRLELLYKKLSTMKPTDPGYAQIKAEAQDYAFALVNGLVIHIGEGNKIKETYKFINQVGEELKKRDIDLHRLLKDSFYYFGDFLQKEMPEELYFANEQLGEDEVMQLVLSGKDITMRDLFFIRPLARDYMEKIIQEKWSYFKDWDVGTRATYYRSEYKLVYAYLRQMGGLKNDKSIAGSTAEFNENELINEINELALEARYQVFQDQDVYLERNLGKMNYLIVKSAQAVLDSENMVQMRKFVNMMERRVIPFMKSKGDPLAKVLPKATDWLVFSIMFFDEKPSRYYKRAIYLSKFSEMHSPRLSALLFSAQGPHLRLNYKPYIDSFDILLYPVLLKSFLPYLAQLYQELSQINPDTDPIRYNEIKKIAQDYAFALMNGLMVKLKDGKKAAYPLMKDIVKDLDGTGIDFKGILKDTFRYFGDYLGKSMPPELAFAHKDLGGTEIEALADSGQNLTMEDLFFIRKPSRKYMVETAEKTRKEKPYTYNADQYLIVSVDDLKVVYRNLRKFAEANDKSIANPVYNKTNMEFVKKIREILKKPADFNWKILESRLRDLTGLPVGVSSFGGNFYLTVDKYFTYSWPALGFQAKGWKGTVVQSGIRNGVFGMTVEFEKKGRKFQKYFQIGFAQKTLTRLVDGKKVSQNYLLITETLGLEALKEVMLKRPEFNLDHIEPYLRNLKGMSIGVSEKHGQYRFSPLPYYEYFWSPLGSYKGDKDGWTGTIMASDVVNGQFEFEVRFTKKDYEPFIEKFYINSETRNLRSSYGKKDAFWDFRMINRRLRDSELSNPPRIYKPKPKNAKAGHIVEDGHPLNFIVTRPSGYDWEKSRSELQELAGQSVGTSSQLGVVDFNPYYGFRYSWAPLGRTEEGLQGKIFNVEIKNNHLGFSVRWAKEGKKPFNVFYQVGPVIKKLPYRRAEKMEPEEALLISNHMALDVLGVLVADPKHFFSGVSDQYKNLVGLSLGTSNNLGQFTIPAGSYYKYRWTAIGREMEGWLGTIVKADFKKNSFEFTVRFTKDGEKTFHRSYIAGGKIKKIHGTHEEQGKYKRVLKIVLLKDRIFKDKLDGGAVVISEVPDILDIKELRSSDGQYGIDGNAVVKMENLYTVKHSTLNEVNETLKINLADVVGALEKKREENLSDETLTYVDLGLGDGTALKELASELKKRGIGNVQLIGVGKNVWKEWFELPGGIKIILCDFKDLHKFIKKGTVDIMMSHYGLSSDYGSRFSDSYWVQLSRLLSDGGMIINSHKLQFSRLDHFSEYKITGSAPSKRDDTGWFYVKTAGKYHLADFTALLERKEQTTPLHKAYPRAAGPMTVPINYDHLQWIVDKLVMDKTYDIQLQHITGGKIEFIVKNHGGIKVKIKKQIGILIRQAGGTLEFSSFAGDTQARILLDWYIAPNIKAENVVKIAGTDRAVVDKSIMTVDEKIRTEDQWIKEIQNKISALNPNAYQEMPGFRGYAPGKLDFQLFMLGQAVLDTENMDEIRGFINLLDGKILPSMRAMGNRMAEIMPTADDWLVYSIMHYDKNETRFVKRTEYLVQLSVIDPEFSKLPALLFSAMGPHLRQSIDMKTDAVDFKLYPVLLKGFLPRLSELYKQLHNLDTQELNNSEEYFRIKAQARDYTMALINGLNIPDVNESGLTEGLKKADIDLAGILKDSFYYFGDFLKENIPKEFNFLKKDFGTLDIIALYNVPNVTMEDLFFVRPIAFGYMKKTEYTYLDAENIYQRLRQMAGVDKAVATKEKDGRAVLRQLVAKPVDFDWNKLEPELRDLKGLYLGETNQKGAYYLSPYQNFNYQWLALGFHDIGWKGTILKSSVKSGYVEFTVEFKKEGMDTIYRSFQMGSLTHQIKGNNKSTGMQREALLISDRMGLEVLSQLITRPQDYDWQNLEDRFQNLNGLSIGVSNKAGQFSFNPLPGFTYSWAALGFKEEGWEGTIIKSGVHNGHFKFTVEFKKEGRNSIYRTFYVGPITKKLIGNQNKQFTQDVLLISETMGLEILQRVVNKPVNFDWRTLDPILKNLAGLSVGRSNTQGGFLFSPIPAFTYYWQALGFEEEGWEGTIIESNIEATYLQFTIEFKKDGRDSIYRTFQIGPRVKELKGSSPQTKGLSQKVLLINSKMGLKVLEKLVTKPVDFDWNNLEAELKNLQGLSIGRSSKTGRFDFFPISQFPYNWSALGFNEEGWEGTIIKSGVIDGHFEFTVEFKKEGFDKIYQTYQIGPIMKDLKGFRDKTGFSERVLLISDSMGLHMLNHFIKKPYGYKWSNIENQIHRLNGLSIGISDQNGQFNFVPFPYFMYSWAALGFREAGWEGRILKTEIKGENLIFDVEFKKSGRTIIRNFALTDIPRILRGRFEKEGEIQVIKKIVNIEELAAFDRREEAKRKVIPHKGQPMGDVVDVSRPDGNFDSKLIFEEVSQTLKQLDNQEKDIALQILEEKLDEEIASAGGYSLEGVRQVRMKLMKRFSWLRDEYLSEAANRKSKDVIKEYKQQDSEKAVIELNDKSAKEVGGIDTPVGGIDMNMTGVNIKESGANPKLKMNLDLIHQENFRGFEPVIINIRPMGNLYQALGLLDTNPKEKKTSPKEDAAFLKAVEPKRAEYAYLN